MIISLLNQLFKQTAHHLSIIATGDVVNNQTNYQVTSAIVTHFMNDTGMCWIIRRTVFNAYIFLNYSWRYKHNQIERHDEKPRDQKAVFSKFRQFLYISVFRERQKCLTCSFVKYTLLKLYSHCTQNYNLTKNCSSSS